MPPFPELRVQLHVDQCACDRAVTKALLDLEQVRTSLIVMKSVGMTEGMESIATAFPPEFCDTVFEDLGKRRFIEDRKSTRLNSSHAT